MSIARMKKLQVIVPRGDARKLIKRLTSEGCLEIERSDDWMSDPSLAAVLTRVPSGGGNTRAFSEVSQSLDALKKYAGVKKGLLQPRTLVSEEDLTENAPSEATLQAVAEINSAAKQIYSLQSERSRLAFGFGITAVVEVGDEGEDVLVGEFHFLVAHLFAEREHLIPFVHLPFCHWVYCKRPASP